MWLSWMKTDLTIYAILVRSRSGMSDFKDEKNFYRSIDMHLLNLETFTDKNKDLSYQYMLCKFGEFQHSSEEGESCRVPWLYGTINSSGYINSFFILTITENVLISFSIGSTISCPLRSADFINNIEHIMNQKFQARTEQQCRDPDCKYRRVSARTAKLTWLSLIPTQSGI